MRHARRWWKRIPPVPEGHCQAVLVNKRRSTLHMQHIPRQRCSRSPGTAVGIAGPVFRTYPQAHPALPGHARLALGCLLACDRASGNAVPARRWTAPVPGPSGRCSLTEQARDNPASSNRATWAGGAPATGVIQTEPPAPRPDSDLLPQHTTDTSITEVPLASNPSAPA